MYDSGSFFFAILSLFGVYHSHPENPKHLKLIYLGFYTSVIIQFVTLVVTLFRINSVNNTTSLSVNNADVAVFPPFLQFLAPATGSITVRNYDLFKLRVRLVTTLLSAAVAYLIAVVFDSPHTLVFAALIPLGSLFFSFELVSLYLYGQTENDDRNLKRPFKQTPLNPITAFKQLMKETKKDLAASGFKVPGASNPKSSPAASPSGSSSSASRGAGQPRRVVRT